MSLLNASAATVKRGLASSTAKAPRMLNGRTIAPTIGRHDSAGMKASFHPLDVGTTLHGLPL